MKIPLQERLRTFFEDDADKAFLTHCIQRNNAVIGAPAGMGIALLELVFIVSAFVHRESHFSAGKVTLYVVFGIMSVALMAVSRRHLRLIEQEGAGDRVFVGYLIAYLIAASIYAVHNTAADFAAGKQIITFMLVMMMNTCIFVTPPAGVLTITTATYVPLYLLAFSDGRLDTGSTVNFWVSWAVVTVAGILRYRESCKSAENERMLLELGERDGLTGLRNRLALRQDFSGLCGKDQYVAMMDLDDFKLVNDTYGHDAGDVVLRTYADALKKTFPDASCYRYGGDEFLLFSPGEKSRDFGNRIEGLRDGIPLIELCDGTQIEVGASAGFVRGVARSEAELRSQIRLADQELYEVKRAHKIGR